MELQPYIDGQIGDIVNPLIEGGVFVRDFYMEDRVAAMAGASAKEYNEANLILGASGFGSSGRPLHTHVLGPDEPGGYWHESIVTPADIGWNPRGASYFWHPSLDDAQNAANWVACGCPSSNAYGDWEDQGVPAELHEWRSLHASERYSRYGGGIPGKTRGRPYRPNKRR